MNIIFATLYSILLLVGTQYCVFLVSRGFCIRTDLDVIRIYITLLYSIANLEDSFHAFWVANIYANIYIIVSALSTFDDALI